MTRAFPAALALALVAAAPKPAGLLARTDLDPALVLPPPPAPDSAQAAAELAELRAVEAARSPAQAAAARAQGEIKDGSIFAEVIGARFDLARLPATAALLALVRASEKEVVAFGKDEFRRPRPWIVVPMIGTCKRSEDEPLSSYPSGHATSAYAYAGVLARLVPTRAPAILARAQAYAETRITCEQHFRSDVTAGQVLGTLVAERLRGRPAFDAAFAAAAAELRRAGIGAAPES